MELIQARYGLAWLGEASLGWARQGMSRSGRARTGNARQGNTLVNLLITLAEASQGTALLG